MRRKYTKENPGKCPPAKFDADEKEWDFSEQRKFLKGQLENVVIPAVTAAQAKREREAGRFLNGKTDPQASHGTSEPPDWPEPELEAPNDDEIPF